MSEDTPRQMLLVGDVLKLIPVSRRQLSRMDRGETRPRFPRSHPLTSGKKPTRAWYADEIVAWQKKLEEIY